MEGLGVIWRGFPSLNFECLSTQMRQAFNQPLLHGFRRLRALVILLKVGTINWPMDSR